MPSYSPDPREPTDRTVPDVAADRLRATVVGFLRDGWEAGEPALVIATPQQARAITAHLAADGLDLPAALQRGELTIVDVEQLLAHVIEPGRVHADRFTHNVVALIEQTRRGRPAPVVRVYSEMVDWLWTHGERLAARHVEALLYGVGQTHAFSLLCGHAMREFYQRTG